MHTQHSEESFKPSLVAHPLVENSTKESQAMLMIQKISSRSASVSTSRNALLIARPTMQGFYMWECVNIKKSQWMTPEIPAFRFGSRLEIEYRDMAVMLSWPLITPW